LYQAAPAKLAKQNTGTGTRSPRGRVVRQKEDRMNPIATVRCLILLIVIPLNTAAHTQESRNLGEYSSQPAIPSDHSSRSYFPGLGEFMGRIQADHAKLWLAGEARNWELADYQLGEMKEVFSDVQDFVPRYKNVPVGDMIEAIMTGAINDLEGAIAARDFAKFSASFDKLTESCNSCHAAAGRPYIAIQRPAQSNFNNQNFAPGK
jgi:hypothetical protein